MNGSGGTYRVIAAVVEYLEVSEGRYELGSDAFYARAALHEALVARLEGNYGIGAVAIDVRDDIVLEYRARNAMLTGEGLVDHAETRAVLAAMRAAPTHRYPRGATACTKALHPGITVYGTLEPCPMCSSVMTNGGVIRSVSTAVDGELKPAVMHASSDGGSTVLNDKWHLQPANWKWLQQQLGMRFELLATDDATLVQLSWAVFRDTAEEVDRALVDRRRERTVD